MKLSALRLVVLFFGEYWLRVLHKDVGKHSLRLVFAMEIFQDQLYLGTIMIMGRWPRNAFLCYIRIQVSYLRKLISALIIITHAFYKIPEAGDIY